MAGLFPINGVTALQTINAASPVNATEGCEKLYHPARCIPRFDPAAANAVISELVNAINIIGPYNCSRLDNLAGVISNLKNLCNQPTTGLNGSDGYENDFLAGCFGGTSGKISVAALMVAVLAQVRGICELPGNTNPALSDTVGMCISGNEYQVPLSTIKALVAPNQAPTPAPVWLDVGTILSGVFMYTTSLGGDPTPGIGGAIQLHYTGGSADENRYIVVTNNELGNQLIVDGLWRHQGVVSIDTVDQSGTPRTTFTTLWQRIA